MKLLLLLIPLFIGSAEMDWWVPQPENGWTRIENQYGAVAARWESEEFVLDIYQFNNALGPLTGSVHLRNKSDREITIYPGRFFLKDKAGFTTEPIGAGQVFGDVDRAVGRYNRDVAETIASHQLKPIETVLEQSSKAANISYDKTWVKMRKRGDFTLLVKGLSIDGEEVKLPPLNLAFERVRVS